MIIPRLRQKKKPEERRRKSTSGTRGRGTGDGGRKGGGGRSDLTGETNRAKDVLTILRAVLSEIK
jgi:hypothetical protein